MSNHEEAFILSRRRARFMCIALVLASACSIVATASSTMIPNPGWQCPNGLEWEECGHVTCGEKYLCTDDGPAMDSIDYQSPAVRQWLNERGLSEELIEDLAERHGLPGIQADISRQLDFGLGAGTQQNANTVQTSEASEISYGPESVQIVETPLLGAPQDLGFGYLYGQRPEDGIDYGLLSQTAIGAPAGEVVVVDAANELDSGTDSYFGLPELSSPDNTLYVPEGIASVLHQEVCLEAENPDIAWYDRAAAYGLCGLVSPLALGEELARSMLNIPYVAQNSAIGLGEHAARSHLWSGQGEYGEAFVEGLHAVEDFSVGFVTLGQLATPASGRGQKVGGGKTSGGATSSSMVWDDVVATDPVNSITNVPKSFVFKTEGGQVWVSGSVTKHFEQDAIARLQRGVTPMSVNTFTQTRLSSLNQAISSAARRGVRYNTRIYEGRWELVFAPPKGSGLLPELRHAVYR